MKIKVQKLDPRAIVPSRARDGDAGYDICALEAVSLAPGEFQPIPTGIALELQDGIEVQVRPRSGLAAKHGISVVNSPGTIDSGYRGDIGVILINLGKETVEVEAGMRIAQLVFNEYLQPELSEVDRLGSTERGQQGYGSTGSK